MSWKNHPSAVMETGDGQSPPTSVECENVGTTGKDKLHNPWPYLAALIEPIYWFWASLEWYSCDPTSDAGDDITTTSFAELAIAF